MSQRAAGSRTSCAQNQLNAALGLNQSEGVKFQTSSSATISSQPTANKTMALEINLMGSLNKQVLTIEQASVQLTICQRCKFDANIGMISEVPAKWCHGEDDDVRCNVMTKWLSYFLEIGFISYRQSSHLTEHVSGSSSCLVSSRSFCTVVSPKDTIAEATRRTRGSPRHMSTNVWTSFVWSASCRRPRNIAH